eukprot:1075235-Pyramimonas_sp.AAC.1
MPSTATQCHQRQGMPGNDTGCRTMTRNAKRRQGMPSNLPSNANHRRPMRRCSDTLSPDWGRAGLID